MKKLKNLKQWHTLESAAKRLTDSFEEEITPRDILQLCFEGQLKLSVILQGARFIEEFEYCPIPTDPYFQIRALIKSPYKYNEIDDEKSEEINSIARELFENSPPVLLQEQGEIKFLRGVYEIDSSSLEHHLLAELVSKETEYMNIDGWAVRGEGGEIYRNQLCRFSDEDIAEMGGSSDPYYPSDELPPIEYLVVQTKHLLELENSILHSDVTQSASMQEKREAVLAELIEESGTDSVKVLGRSGTWQVLSKMDKYLFGHRGEETINKFFNKQKLISYR